MRIERGWTVEQVAQHLLCSPSKVSRLETGQRGASARDIRDLCNLYGVGDEQRQHLMTLASEGKQRAWWQPLGLPYSTYVGLESEARSIRDYGIGHLPGLLQTEDYARAVLRCQVPPWVPEVIEQRVYGRMTRQRILTSDNPPRFRVVIDESVLRRVVGGPAVMKEQLGRLLEISELPAVSIRVIRHDAGALPGGNCKFIILGFAKPALPDVVYIEGLTGDLFLDEGKEVENYAVAFEALTKVAASEPDTRGVIAGLIGAI
jgi:transcriptional regulator with XRE-family HTH domain